MRSSSVLSISSIALLHVALAGCSGHDDQLGSTLPPDASAPACSDTSAAPVDIDELHAEPCELRGLDTAAIAEITAAQDGALYVLTSAGVVERFAFGGSGACTFTRDASYTAPAAHVASIEGSADGRLYATYLAGTQAVLAWDDGQCSSSTRFRPQIAPAADGSVVLAPATASGLVAVDTATCTTTPLAFVSTETPRVFGRVGTDVVWGGPSDTGVGRATLAGVDKYRLTDHAFGGRDDATLEAVGTRIAGWALGYLFSVDADTGAQLPAIKYDRFFAASASREVADEARFDAAPDGHTAYVLGVAPGTGECAVRSWLYKLTD